MQYKEVAGGICAPKGFAAAGVHCGIRANHSEKYDLALIKAEVLCFNRHNKSSVSLGNDCLLQKLLIVRGVNH